LQQATHRYLHGPAGQVLADEVFAAGAGGQRVSDDILWQLADQQGTIRDIVSSAGVLRKHVDYDSFGRIGLETYYYENGEPIESLEPVELNAEAVDQLFYFQGQERDSATGLQKHGVRWYDPFTGRWRSTDPSGLGPDANLYRYVGNGPTNFTDPSGLFQQGNPLNNLFAGGYSGGTVAAYRPPSSAIASGFKAIGNSVLSSGVNLVNSVYSAGVNLTNNFGEISSLYTQSNTITSQLAGIEQARAHRNQFPQAARFGPSSSALNTQYNTLASQRLAVDANIQNIISTSIFGGPRVEIVSNPGGTQYVTIGQATRDSGGYWSGVGEVGKGYGDAAVSTAQGVYSVFRHPVNTIQGVGTAIAHPILTGQTIFSDIYDRSQTLRGQGSLFGDALIGLASGGTAKVVKEAGLVGKITGKIRGLIDNAPSSKSLNILNPEFVPNGRTIVNAVAQEQANKGRQFLVDSLSDAQKKVYNSNPAAGSRFLGTAVHKSTADALRDLYNGRFKYNTVGPDFLDTVTKELVELTTPGQVASHVAKGGAYLAAKYATYVLPKK
jgi:RHS repeat-associated protein